MKTVYAGIFGLIVGVIGFYSFGEKQLETRTVEDNYKIITRWELPGDLEEVSGIVWIGDRRVACIQDEKGTIFIYDLDSSKIESSVSFGDEGDYEGIAVIEEDAYVLKSDGIIFEIKDFKGGDPRVNRYVTELNQLPGIDLEGFCADPANNRLLLAVKDRDNRPEQKEVFVFDLADKEIIMDPLFVVDLNDEIFGKIDEKTEEKFSPGEIGIHPETGEHYILDGTRPKLLISGKDGTPKELFLLNSQDFGNPEGLTFSPDGDLYISNEAEDAPANILQVVLHRTKN